MKNFLNFKLDLYILSMNTIGTDSTVVCEGYLFPKC